MVFLTRFCHCFCSAPYDRSKMMDMQFATKIKWDSWIYFIKTFKVRLSSNNKFILVRGNLLTLEWKWSSRWLESWEGLLLAADVSITCAEAIFSRTRLWRWLPHSLPKRQWLTAVLLRTPVAQMTFFNKSMLLLGSNFFLTPKPCRITAGTRQTILANTRCLWICQTHCDFDMSFIWILGWQYQSIKFVE